MAHKAALPHNCQQKPSGLNYFSSQAGTKTYKLKTMILSVCRSVSTKTVWQHRVVYLSLDWRDTVPITVTKDSLLRSTKLAVEYLIRTLPCWQLMCNRSGKARLMKNCNQSLLCGFFMYITSGNF